MLEEKISKHLQEPYVYLPKQKKFLCENGVIFSLEEYKNGIDINAEYERRAKEDTLYDYEYAKNTGLLRKKKQNKSVIENQESTVADLYNIPSGGIQKARQGKSIAFIITLLAITSLISGYVSTLHTATYLYDYVDVISAWLMSISVTIYNATAFEVAVVFKSKKRYGLTFVFILLWAIVTLFSMATTVSIFYDRFNFTETQIAEENKLANSNRLALELLQKKEKDLRESIEFKKQDIQYRQEKEYATTAVRRELNSLQEELQKNLTEQQKLLEETPEVKEEKIKQKESLFAFLGRLIGIESGILEFIMSTLSAVFVNLISPLSLVAVAELGNKKENNLTK